MSPRQCKWDVRLTNLCFKLIASNQGKKKTGSREQSTCGQPVSGAPAFSSPHVCIAQSGKPKTKRANFCRTNHPRKKWRTVSATSLTRQLWKFIQTQVHSLSQRESRTKQLTACTASYVSLHRHNCSVVPVASYKDSRNTHTSSQATINHSSQTLLT